jgi:hypothetical protein
MGDSARLYTPQIVSRIDVVSDIIGAVGQGIAELKPPNPTE